MEKFNSLAHLPCVEGLTFAGPKFGAVNEDGGCVHLDAASAGSTAGRTPLFSCIPLASCE